MAPALASKPCFPCHTPISYACNVYADMDASVCPHCLNQRELPFKATAVHINNPESLFMVVNHEDSPHLSNASNSNPASTSSGSYDANNDHPRHDKLRPKVARTQAVQSPAPALFRTTAMTAGAAPADSLKPQLPDGRSNNLVGFAGLPDVSPAPAPAAISNTITNGHTHHQAEQQQLHVPGQEQRVHVSESHLPRDNATSAVLPVTLTPASGTAAATALPLTSTPMHVELTTTAGADLAILSPDAPHAVLGSASNSHTGTHQEQQVDRTQLPTSTNPIPSDQQMTNLVSTATLALTDTYVGVAVTPTVNGASTSVSTDNLLHASTSRPGPSSDPQTIFTSVPVQAVHDNSNTLFMYDPVCAGSSAAVLAAGYDPTLVYGTEHTASGFPAVQSLPAFEFGRFEFGASTASTNPLAFMGVAQAGLAAAIARGVTVKPPPSATRLLQQQAKQLARQAQAPQLLPPDDNGLEQPPGAPVAPTQQQQRLDLQHQLQQQIQQGHAATHQRQLHTQALEEQLLQMRVQQQQIMVTAGTSLLTWPVQSVPKQQVVHLGTNTLMSGRATASSGSMGRMPEGSNVAIPFSAVGLSGSVPPSLSSSSTSTAGLTIAAATGGAGTRGLIPPPRLSGTTLGPIGGSAVHHSITDIPPHCVQVTQMYAEAAAADLLTDGLSNGVSCQSMNEQPPLGCMSQCVLHPVFFADIHLCLPFVCSNF